MAYLLATAFAAYTATASSALADHPAANAALLLSPFRTWRSTTDAQSWLRCDLGTATVLDGVFLNFTNVERVTVQRSSDGASFTDLLTAAALPLDTRVNRRKAYLRFAGFNHRYLRLLLNTADIVPLHGGTVPSSPGEEEFTLEVGYFELGTVACVKAVTVLDAASEHAPQFPLTHVRRNGRDVIDFLSGGYEVVDEGPFYLEATLRLAGARLAGATAAAIVSAITIGQAFMLADEADVSRAYLFRRAEDDAVTEDFATLARPLTVREAV